MLPEGDAYFLCVFQYRKPSIMSAPSGTPWLPGAGRAIGNGDGSGGMPRRAAQSDSRGGIVAGDKVVIHRERVGPLAGGTPIETTRRQAIPQLTAVPGAGLWLITLPEGTVSLNWVVTAAHHQTRTGDGRRRRRLRLPTTLGQPPAGDDEADRRSNDGCVMAAGIWLMTRQWHDVLTSIVRAPRFRPYVAEDGLSLPLPSDRQRLGTFTSGERPKP